MTHDKIKDRLGEMASHLTFEYDGVECGVDPISRDHYDMWYGDKFITVNDIDDVMSTHFFKNSPLKDIAHQIRIIDW